MKSKFKSHPFNNWLSAPCQKPPIQQLALSPLPKVTHLTIGSQPLAQSQNFPPPPTPHSPPPDTASAVPLSTT